MFKRRQQQRDVSSSLDRNINRKQQKKGTVRGIALLVCVGACAIVLFYFVFVSHSDRPDVSLLTMTLDIPTNPSETKQQERQTAKTSTNKASKQSNGNIVGDSIRKIMEANDKEQKDIKLEELDEDSEIDIEAQALVLAQMTVGDENENENIDENADFSELETDDADNDCIFRDSPIYRKIYVYPNYGDVDNGWSGSILSDAGKDLSTLPRWPWLDMDATARKNETALYNIWSAHHQYATELLVREVITNPNSCLRTYDPEEATLFYVPYLPSIEHHQGDDRKLDYSTSPYGQAIMDIIDREEYSGWEATFGLTSKYWKQRGGSDHILVFSEPMHGLYHPRSRRGNFHFIHSQKQLRPPIVISVELSTTFVQMYPNCAKKNILMPYPNSHGRWFNGEFKRETRQSLEQNKLTVQNSGVALQAEVELAASNAPNAADARPITQFYKAGNHGTCSKLRKAMQADYQKCSKSFGALKKLEYDKKYWMGMRVATFCPCPGGDSPSAKRHFDALLAGCIPIILSEDFVWPFTKEFDEDIELDPADFSIRLQASDYDDPLLDENCKPLDPNKPGFEAYLQSIPATEIERLRRGVERARELYGWYRQDDVDLGDNPLKAGVLPNGGTAHALVHALAERAAGARWPACEVELTQPRKEDPTKFKC